MRYIKKEVPPQIINSSSYSAIMTETTKPPTFTEDLSLLFPIPSRAPSVLSPIAPPGVNREAADELVRLLKENHVRFHGFFNDKGFHK